jgi:hypothetical protein
MLDPRGGDVTPQVWHQPATEGHEKPDDSPVTSGARPPRYCRTEVREHGDWHVTEAEGHEKPDDSPVTSGARPDRAGGRPEGGHRMCER